MLTRAYTRVRVVLFYVYTYTTAVYTHLVYIIHTRDGKASVQYLEALLQSMR